MTTSGEREFLDLETLPMDEVNDEDPVVETEEEYGVVNDDPPGSPPPDDNAPQNEVADDERNEAVDSDA